LPYIRGMKITTTKKQDKVIRTLNNTTKKKVSTLFSTLEKGVSINGLRESYDVSELIIPKYKGQGKWRVKIDYRHRVIVQVQDNGQVGFVDIMNREGYLK